MQLLEIDQIPYFLDRLKWELPSLDLIAWLSRQPLYPKVFWKEKEGTVVRAAVGSLLSFSHVPNFTSDQSPDVRFYGGMRFARKKHNDETWRSFPQTCFWLPQIEVSQDFDKTEVIVQSLGEKSSLAETIPWDFAETPFDASLASLIDRQEAPDFPLWQQSVDQVLEEIATGRLDKLVLARRSSLHFDSPISPWPLLAHLREIATQTTVFAFQLAPHLCFLGATPEKLFQRNQRQLTADAVAATRARGMTAEEDLLLEQDLLSHGKERREFQFVSEFLETAMQPISDKIMWDWPQARVLKASHVQHLHNRLTARLQPEISDRDLIAALHPTPALGGYPRDKALSYLTALEPFDRGWYGAPIGVIGPHETSLYAGIRSGLIRERALHLFAGTGLVSGSTAEKEWEELEQKIRPFTELFLTPVTRKTPENNKTLVFSL